MTEPELNDLQRNNAIFFVGRRANMSVVSEEKTAYWWNGNRPGKWDGGRFVSNMFKPGEVIS